jgi:hypothetical protein
MAIGQAIHSFWRESIYCSASWAFQSAQNAGATASVTSVNRTAKRIDIGFSLAGSLAWIDIAGPARTLHNLHKVSLDTIATVGYTQLQISSNPSRFCLNGRGGGRNDASSILQAEIVVQLVAT